MTRFMKLYHRRARLQRRQRFHDMKIANQRAWSPYCEIEDLRDPHGKRFLFDDFEGMAQQSTFAVEDTPCSYLGPQMSNECYDPYSPHVWCVRVARMLADPCAGCALPSLRARAPADPT